MAMMSQIRDHGNPIEPPGYQAMGMTVIRKQCLKLGGRCRNTLVEDDLQLANNQPWLEMPSNDKASIGGRLIGITYRVVYGDPKEVTALMGLNTAYVEKTNLTSRQMNGRMVRKTL
jgi:hypothetical protein